MAGERILSIMNQVRHEEKNDTTDLMFGVVTSTSPLKIKVENRFEITEEFIILSALCREMTITIPAHKHTVTTSIGDGGIHTHSIAAGTSGSTTVGGIAHTHSIPEATAPSAGAHSHTASSSSANALTSITLWRNLQVNDKVLMLRVSKGQMYYVLERKEGVV